MSCNLVGSVVTAQIYVSNTAESIERAKIIVSERERSESHLKLLEYFIVLKT